MSIEIGAKGRAETVVTEHNTANAVGSGLVPVFATPYMIALMENAAVNAVGPYMAEGEGPWAPAWTYLTTRRPLSV